MGFFDWFSLAFLLAFLCAFIGRTLVLSARGTRVFMIAEGKGGVRAVIEVGGVVLLALFLALVAVQSVHVPAFAPLRRALFSWIPGRIAGAVLLAAGLILFVSGLVSFGSSWRIGIDKQKPGELTTTGAFALTRNPVFLAFDLCFIGTFLVYPTWPFLVLGVVFIAGVHVHILEEERFLTGRYGAPYLGYCARVPRYLVIRRLPVRKEGGR